MEKLVDPRCYELAAFFLNPDATETMKMELADWIQHHIELWLFDDKEGAHKAAEQLGDELPRMAARVEALRDNP